MKTITTITELHAVLDNLQNSQSTQKHAGVKGNEEGMAVTKRIRDRLNTGHPLSQKQAGWIQEQLNIPHHKKNGLDNIDVDWETIFDQKPTQIIASSLFKSPKDSHDELKLELEQLRRDRDELIKLLESEGVENQKLSDLNDELEKCCNQSLNLVEEKQKEIDYLIAVRDAAG